jgi:hypothetical protein
MSNEALESAPVARPDDQGRAYPNDQHDLPNRWCFGLAHPYIQRMIFLAGALELSAPDLEGDCRPDSGQPEV